MTPDLSVVVPYVNDPSDLAKYPRTLERDATLAASAGVDVIYAPDVTAIYPEGFSTAVTVSGVTENGASCQTPPTS